MQRLSYLARYSKCKTPTARFKLLQAVVVDIRKRGGEAGVIADDVGEAMDDAKAANTAVMSMDGPPRPFK